MINVVKHQIPNSKHQAPNPKRYWLFWNLEFALPAAAKRRRVIWNFKEVFTFHENLT